MSFLRRMSLQDWQSTVLRCFVVFSCCWGCAPRELPIQRAKAETTGIESDEQSRAFEKLVIKYRAEPNLQTIAAVRAASRNLPNEEQRLSRQILWARLYFLALAADVENHDLTTLESALSVERQSILEMAAHYNYEREKMLDVFGKMQNDIVSEFRYFETLHAKE